MNRRRLETQLTSDEMELLTRLGIDFNEGFHGGQIHQLSQTELEVLELGGALGLHLVEAAAENELLIYLRFLINDWRDLLNECYGAKAVADLLMVQQKEVESLLGKRQLYAVRLQKPEQLLFPKWEFTDSGALPHLGSLLPIVTNSHPLSLSQFMLTRTVDLEVSGEPLSPREWLIAGYNPGPVLVLAHDL